MRLELKHGVHCHWRRVEAVAIKVDEQKYKTPRFRFPLYIFRFITSTYNFRMSTTARMQSPLFIVSKASFISPSVLR